MKIKLLCNDNARFAAIRRTLLEKAPGAEVSGGAGAVEDLPAFINGSMPDVLVLDGVTSRSLDAVEALNLRRPEIDTLLISGEASTDFLLQAMRAGVREVVPAPGPGEALQSALGRIMLKRKAPSNTADGGKVFAFLSCKGGAGATFLASNFAYAMATERGKRVALIDLNLQFGDAAMFVSDQRPPSNVAEVSQQINRLDASLLASAMLEVAPNFHVLAAPDDPAHSTDVRREHVEAIVRLARRNYDAVVIDVARSLDVVSLKALDLADTILPVLQLTLPFVRDGKRLLSVFQALDYPKESVRLLVNRFQKGGEITLEDLERSVGHQVFRTIPNSYAAAASSVNLGVPIAKGQRSNPISKVLVELAHELMPAQETAAAGGRWFARVFGRANA